MRLSLNQLQSDLKDCAISALSIRSAGGEPVVTCTPVSRWAITPERIFRRRPGQSHFTTQRQEPVPERQPVQAEF